MLVSIGQSLKHPLISTIFMNLKNLLIPFCALFLWFPSIVKGDPLLMMPEPPAHILVNNRILAKVNGKAISVIDVMKKMDILFYREFPQYTNSSQARFQFYQANWKHLMQELVDKELMMADAEENKLPVSSGDVRQEMERLFGPNIIGNLDKIGMSFDEALKIVQGDITIHRMLFIRVNSKALRKVTPQDVSTYYEQNAASNIRPDEWIYQVVSIRNKDASAGAEAANLAHDMLANDLMALNDLPKKIEDHPTLGKNSKVTISEEHHHTDKEISPAYKEILAQMESNTYSKPIAQKSRSDNSTVFRLFFLKEKIAGGIPPFSEVEARIKDKLLEKAIVEESKTYIKKLRKHFDVQESVPENFQPFSLK